MKKKKYKKKISRIPKYRQRIVISDGQIATNDSMIVVVDINKQCVVKQLGAGTNKESVVEHFSQQSNGDILAIQSLSKQFSRIHVEKLLRYSFESKKCSEEFEFEKSPSHSLEVDGGKKMLVTFKKGSEIFDFQNMKTFGSDEEDDRFEKNMFNKKLFELKNGIVILVAFEGFIDVFKEEKLISRTDSKEGYCYIDAACGSTKQTGNFMYFYNADTPAIEVWDYDDPLKPVVKKQLVVGDIGDNVCIVQEEIKVLTELKYSSNKKESYVALVTEGSTEYSSPDSWSYLRIWNIFTGKLVIFHSDWDFFRVGQMLQLENGDLICSECSETLTYDYDYNTDKTKFMILKLNLEKKKLTIIKKFEIECVCCTQMEIYRNKVELWNKRSHSTFPSAFRNTVYCMIWIWKFIKLPEDILFYEILPFLKKGDFEFKKLKDKSVSFREYI